MAPLDDRALMALTVVESLESYKEAGRLPEEAIDRFNQALDVLETVAPGVAEQKIPTDRLHQASARLPRSAPRGRLTRPEAPEGFGPLYCPWSDFEPIRSTVLRYVRYKMNESPSPLSSIRDGSAVIQQRQQLLATLVDAYLKVPEQFSALAGDDVVTIYHPGLPNGQITPEWSHVEALGQEGLLFLRTGSRRGTWTINIPTQVLGEIKRMLPRIEFAPPGEEREEAVQSAVTTIINHHYYGDGYNIAQNSSNFSQAVTLGVRPGDLGSLFDALQKIGISGQDLPALQNALEEDSAKAGRRSIGAKVLGWIGERVTKMTDQAAAAGVGAAVPVAGQMAPELYREIYNAVAAYIG